MTLKTQLKDYINACFTGVWVQTHEPDETEREIRELAQERGWILGRWDIAQGWNLVLPELTGPADEGNPLAVLKALSRMSRPGTDDTTVFVLHNYHLFLKAPQVMQELFNRLVAGKINRTFVVVLSPVVQIPTELEKVMVVLNHELPDADVLDGIASELAESTETTHDAASVRAAAGLTRYEAEGSFALSLARSGRITPEAVWELKESMLKKSGLLRMYRGTESFADLGGLEGLKQFCRKALHPGRPVKPKGILILGVPGTGKSAFAKALGKETDRPTLILDIGALFGSLVGQTEERVRQALAIADAMAPCVLFVDEIEKALSGVGGQGDSGISTRLFGTLLTWLNDHDSDVFFIGTCNDVSKLPPEFSRAERFDGIFFIDLPQKDEKDLIWLMYRDHYQPTGTTPSDDTWTGAEIKACCRLAALLDVPLHQAARHVVPVAVTAAAKVQELREWASNRCLSAQTGTIYDHRPPLPPSNGTATRRIIKKGASV